MTGSGMALPDVSGSTGCSTGFVESCIKGGGGELPPGRVALRLGEREGLRFLSRLNGDLRRGDGDLRLGDGDLVLRLEIGKVNNELDQNKTMLHSSDSEEEELHYLLGLFD